MRRRYADTALNSQAMAGQPEMPLSDPPSDNSASHRARTDRSSGEPAATGQGSRWFNVPNTITFVRLAGLPVFLWLLFDQEDRGTAALVLTAIGATDWLDGFAARRLNQVTNLGKIIDPVADRLVFLVGGTAVLIDGSMPPLFAALLLAREAIVSIATVAVAAAGGRRIDVLWVGKAGTFLLMGAVPSFLASHSTWQSADVFGVVAWVVGSVGLVLSYYAAASYVPAAIEALREGRAART